MVKDMFSEAGLDGNKTNHSLRVAGTSSLYEAGVPEKVIQSRTGHRCLESLRLYERVNTTQEMAVSRILTGETEKCDESIPLKSDDPAIVEAQEEHRSHYFLEFSVTIAMFFLVRLNSPTFHLFLYHFHITTIIHFPQCHHYIHQYLKRKAQLINKSGATDLTYRTMILLFMYY